MKVRVRALGFVGGALLLAAPGALAAGGSGPASAKLSVIALADKLDHAEVSLQDVRVIIDGAPGRDRVRASEVAAALETLVTKLHRWALRLDLKKERRAELVDQVNRLLDLSRGISRFFAGRDVVLDGDLGPAAPASRALRVLATSIGDTIADFRRVTEERRRPIGWPMGFSALGVWNIRG